MAEVTGPGPEPRPSPSAAQHTPRPLHPTAARAQVRQLEQALLGHGLGARAGSPHGRAAPSVARSRAGKPDDLISHPGSATGPPRTTSLRFSQTGGDSTRDVNGTILVKHRGQCLVHKVLNKHLLMKPTLGLVPNYSLSSRQGTPGLFL